MNELSIRGLSQDTRTLNSGDAFIALKGLVQDGRRYIPEAIGKGAAALLVEVDKSVDKNSPTALDEFQTLKKDIEIQTQKLKTDHVPVIFYSELRHSIGHIASRFYSQPSKSMSVIGITGTNGKTSCSHFIAQIFSSVGVLCGVMGTLGSGLLPALHENGCTTLDPIQTQKQLFDLKNKGALSVAMEVTSHALTQGRVEGVQFHTAIFTNLTRDHLDYHENMQAYYHAKKRLFKDHRPHYLIINVDDEFGRRLLKEVIADTAQEYSSNKSLQNEAVHTPFFQKAPVEIIGYSISSEDPEIQSLVSRFKNIQGFSLVTGNILSVGSTGIKALVHTPWGEGTLESPLLGRFNLSNILASLSAVCVQGVSFEKALKAIQHLKTVAGRMTTLGGEKNQPTVVVDYAHTPDALSKVLKALRLHCRGKLWCIFGCGGDRDRGKRSEMAKVVEELSDKIVITQDNPRTEDPHRIIEDIISGLKNPTNINNTISIEPNRHSAILETVLAGEPEDIILVAGKGHEEYQIIGTEKHPFSDTVEVIHALNKRAQ